MILAHEKELTKTARPCKCAATPLAAKVAPVEYNYRSCTIAGEEHGLSVFFRLDDESITDAYTLLDLTPYGRQLDFEDSPPGWPQRPTYG